MNTYRTLIVVMGIVVAVLAINSGFAQTTEKQAHSPKIEIKAQKAKKASKARKAEKSISKKQAKLVKLERPIPKQKLKHKSDFKSKPRKVVEG